MTEPDFPEPTKPRRPVVDRERIVANREMGRALRAIQSVRIFYVVLAIGGAIWTPIAFAVASEAGGGLYYAAAGITLAFAGVAAVGAWRIAREPLVWSVVIAVVWSIKTLIGLLTPPHLTFGDILSMVCAAGCWAAVMVIRPAMALMRKYPDLRIAQKLRGKRR